jgi:hypothetical protein
MLFTLYFISSAKLAKIKQLVIHFANKKSRIIFFNNSTTIFGYGVPLEKKLVKKTFVFLLQLVMGK